MKYRLLLAAIWMLGILSCQESEAPARPLVETHWLIRSVDGDTSGVSGLSPRPYLMIREGSEGMRFQVHAGCNNMLGHVETDSVSSLRFTRIASTRKMCERMELEDAMQAILPEIDAFRISGETLYLSAGKAERVMLEAGPRAVQ